MKKVIEVKEYIVRTSEIEYDEEALCLSKKLTETEILQDVAHVIEMMGLNKCTSVVSEEVTDIELGGIPLESIEPVRVTSRITEEK